ncbi:MAG: 1-deoxy-D-xylulose-5-phosphate reductoisomerase [Clostridiales bacterium]|nr:1-deoxy-D-xylulose-5-phosphate reductoisomerase [Clostridiales bacterium]
MGRIRLAVLGSTGSIGRQTLEVAAAHADRVEVVALAAHSSAKLIVEQAVAHGVKRIALADERAADRAAQLTSGLDVTVASGAPAVAHIAVASDADVVVNALVGAVGLRATVNSLESGATLGLANKESLVAGGDLVMRLARPGRVIPVDSEHSAIFQCLTGEDARDVTALWLTASGGPFRGRTREQLINVTAEDALAHPTWRMGRKISIDSATLMNKGLEAIEAHHLFAVDYDRIRIVVHPQSCIHSMVEYADGSVKAHLGATDMRIPIQYALSHPRRWHAPVEPVDFARAGSLDFEPPDIETFRCLALAFEAGRAGGTMPAVLNAANEVAVAAFLGGACGFTAIEAAVERVMEAHNAETIDSLEHIEAVDAWARTRAADVLRL